ncbi:MAG TPA: dephospho-CoA kinase [Actinomycetota bacterium]|nr:MAG: dephospho-CoA kinase [Actinomycetota bacterium]HNL52133.1 dephospho-CoA kinase [Actinomycetota bacterium]HUM86325.1 dephospho-CoA kinase [Actinomycetota bacterium]
MRRVGLTGGIGSGKSTVAQMFADLGAWVVDADAIAREVVAPGSEGLAELVERFGSQILTDNGDLDRAAVAAVVFSDPSARERLNAIVHPLIARRTTELIAAIPQDAVLVHDVPLLVELGMQATYDLVVVVDAPDDVRVQRLVQRGLDEDDARARIAAQASRDERLAVADVIIENTGDLDDLRTQVKAAWPQVSGQP